MRSREARAALMLAIVAALAYLLTQAFAFNHTYN